ncbi:MAG: L-threonylcarbamoyladenylate synthase [Balneolaceae bacterium]
MTTREAAELLRQGHLVAFPTETVYGLGADAWNAEAIARLYKQKGRPPDNPLIVHLSSMEQVSDFASEIPEQAKPLMKKCWPGPLTLVVKKRESVLDLITATLPTVALRIPDHPLALELIELVGPLVAPSANRSGRPSPTRAEHVRFDFGHEFPVLDGGECSIGLESTVLDVSQFPFSILRPGRYSAGELSTIAGTDISRGGREGGSPRSPGTKYTHYKPEAEVRWAGTPSPPNLDKTLFITHLEAGDYTHSVHFEGDYDALANQLYDLFRTADQKGFSAIAIEPLPDNLSHPITDALRNRIEKAIGLK